MSEPIKITFFEGDAIVRARLTEIKVFPSPFTVDVTNTTFPFLLGNIKFILVIRILNASAIGERSFTLINSSAPFSSCGISPITGLPWESFSISCLDLILLSNNSNNK